MYERPLRSDELMHHKYIDKVRGKNGAWRYIYDLAGGKYKKQAMKYKAEAQRDQKISDYLHDKGKQYEHDADINTVSRNAHNRAALRNNGLSYEQKKESLRKSEEHQRKIVESNTKAEDSYNKAYDRYINSRLNEEKSKNYNNKYKNSLAYKYDTRKQIVNSTVAGAKKSVNKGKNFFKKLFG